MSFSSIWIQLFESNRLWFFKINVCLVRFMFSLFLKISWNLGGSSSIGWSWVKLKGEDDILEWRLLTLGLGFVNRLEKFHNFLELRREFFHW